ncbi:MAG: hypothetical protein KAT58_01445 [candidate division Zixibacteria bacterium]|nr:hypothetical protein [candidate division Zixibacteria bacterium]
MIEESKRWHHRPAHFSIPHTAHMVTAGTLHKEHFFREEDRLQLLQQTLFTVTTAYDWQLQAWAVFANRYHFIAFSPGDAATLRPMLQRLHSQTAREINRLDGAQGRRVWFQYWDTCLTYERSFYARLNYVHNNAVHHGLVTAAAQYRYCSAGCFERHAKASYRKKVESFRYDRVNVRDDF